MKGRLIAVDRWQGRPAAALVEDGRLQDLIVDPPKDGPPPPGTVFRAVPDRPMKGQGGLFLRLPGGAKGFLRLGKADPPPPGRPLSVQVASYAEPGKAPPMTATLSLKSRYVLVTPGAPGANISRQIRAPEIRAQLAALLAETAPDHGVILRSAAAEADPDAIRADLAATLAATDALLRHAGDAPDRLRPGPSAADLAWRDWPAAEVWDETQGAFARHGIDALIDAALAPEQALSGGARAWIEPTRALIAVDVDTGADASPAAGLKANIALARALPRLLRCRGLGGQIVVDMAPMPKKDRRGVETALKAAFRADPVETAILGWTALGHVELQRHRARWPVL